GPGAVRRPGRLPAGASGHLGLDDGDAGGGSGRLRGVSAHINLPRPAYNGTAAQGRSSLYLGRHAMRKQLFFWELAGFLVTGALGSLLHFVYQWSGENQVAAA